MCGIIGIISKDPAINSIYPALIALQHRGQDAAGAATYENGFHVKKGMGLVTNVFSQKHLQRMRGTGTSVFSPRIFMTLNCWPTS